MRERKIKRRGKWAMEMVLVLKSKSGERSGWHGVLAVERGGWPLQIAMVVVFPDHLKP
ncbi:hypothetical protein HanXRQr2_Chr02g0064011 [Helianthus annuus]|uniref:Uncharacterized protein n=1 Tax=Helianthus annuus TaxID=4232 RepID=A0A251VGL8_HELAN|nr:hypothetical protein HanXRQr2_Chr02g0064011 [Helianthus annuus]KAJ0615188.1 hypothetical protein HanIR_Chr02g0071181 [Helianthus annuus]KAJ0618655.1 hypothetical protein HanHA89_Chr02g0055921 [Helianthus annuus]KAJ0951657.1 hypothetical protein HanPSC8_Chr02g0062821 [Helianthus annuus]